MSLNVPCHDRSLPLFARRTVLVDAHAGGINHHQFAIVSGRNRRQKPVPNPGSAPADKTIVAGCRRSIALRNFGPRRSRAKAPHDPVENPTVIHAGYTAACCVAMAR